MSTVTFPWFNGQYTIRYETREDKAMTQEQEQARLRAELVARYGEKAYDRALEMSGLRFCLEALATDDLAEAERARAYQQAGAHLAKLHASFMTRDESVALTECARRIDSALELWLADSLEERDGLPHLIGKK